LRRVVFSCAKVRSAKTHLGDPPPLFAIPRLFQFYLIISLSKPSK
jgi:hypothetical protein